MDFDHRLEQGRPPQLGMIVLQSDETLEPDLHQILPAPIEVLVSRVPSGAEVTSESLAAMDGALAQAASLMPRAARFGAVGYGCTSATAEIGAARVHAQIRSGLPRPVVPVTEPLSALLAACRALGVTRIGLVSPYIESVSARLRAAFEVGGLEVTRFGSFNVAEEARVVRIAGASVVEAARQVGQEEACEAVFLSCTNLRTLHVIEDIETALGKPVLSSNQVLGWHLAQLAGLSGHARIPGALGRL